MSTTKVPLVDNQSSLLISSFFGSKYYAGGSGWHHDGKDVKMPIKSKFKKTRHPIIFNRTNRRAMDASLSWLWYCTTICVGCSHRLLNFSNFTCVLQNALECILWICDESSLCEDTQLRLLSKLESRRRLDKHGGFSLGLMFYGFTSSV